MKQICPPPPKPHTHICPGMEESERNILVSGLVSLVHWKVNHPNPNSCVKICRWHSICKRLWLRDTESLKLNAQLLHLNVDMKEDGTRGNHCWSEWTMLILIKLKVWLGIRQLHVLNLYLGFPFLLLVHVALCINQGSWEPIQSKAQWKVSVFSVGTLHSMSYCLSSNWWPKPQAQANRSAIYQVQLQNKPCCNALGLLQ